MQGGGRTQGWGCQGLFGGERGAGKWDICPKVASAPWDQRTLGTTQGWGDHGVQRGATPGVRGTGASVKCYNLAGAFPQNTFFGADSQHQPGAGAKGMRPNTFVPWPKLAGVLAAAPLPGEPALGTQPPCAAVAAAACQRRERAVIHRSPARLIFMTQLRYGADMKCGAGSGGK